ncbi:MAG TPA: selenocysteine-specific translation elongation factor [Solirubrobacteraceae bacterium]|nr:selenocysteine-specific translation elongation factor [Solirubrobacteraceae bacterium]
MSGPGAPLTLGTAGHIDHGKTALVAALTGHDTDRLPEEKRRGISIALGYAPLILPSGRRLSVVDVPGHERFVRTMVAGATGVDLFLMTVAADDGVMPQTREHAAVLAGLRVGEGVVAVTKADLADPARALAQAAELLPGVPAVAVSARTGAGLDELRAALEGVAAGLPGRAPAGGDPRLHVDRAFTIRGAGTVVTGTLWSGAVARGDAVELLPSGRRARVRAVQVHDAPAPRAEAGQRVALNLAGLSVREVGRGDVVTVPGSTLRAAYVVDAALDLPDPARRPEHGERVQVHHGTRETPARLAELGGRFWQLRLEAPIVAARGDRLVLRRVAPPDTLGGGEVLDPHARKHGPSRDALARLERLARGEREAPAREPEASTAPARPAPAPLSPGALALEERLRAAGHEPPIASALGDDAVHLAALRAAGRAVRVGRALHFHPEALAAIERRVTARIEAEGSISLAGLRDELGTSRKFAQALLEHFDGAGVTRRLPDDRRVLRRGRGRDGSRQAPRRK